MYLKASAICADFTDLSTATQDLFPHGDVLEFLGQRTGRSTQFRSRARNVVIDVPQYLLRSLYFRACNGEITIEHEAQKF
ncbi:MAG TPA: hypothetical protein V6D17_16575 [Candidatus Obscuribacterales bacterium]